MLIRETKLKTFIILFLFILLLTSCSKKSRVTGVGDTTAPVISNVASSATSSGATITWTTDETATSQVEYGTSISYGSATTEDTTLTTSHSVDITGLSASLVYHYRVKSKDASNNQAISDDDDTFTTTADTTGPVISDVSVPMATLKNTSARITWTTNEAATTKIEWGTISGSYGNESEKDTATLVTSHSIYISGLTANTLYYYRVSSRDANSNETPDTEKSFTTLTTATSKYDFESDTQGWVYQTWTDSQACTAVAQSSTQAKFGSNSLEMTMDLVGSDPEEHKAKGEAYVDMIDDPLEGITAPVDLDGIEVSVWVYCPAGSSGDTSAPNGLQILFKDSNWANRYSTWVNLTSGDEDTWIKITDTPSTSTPTEGFQDDDFDPTQIRRVGVKMGAGTGSTATYSGSIYIDGFDW